MGVHTGRGIRETAGALVDSVQLDLTWTLDKRHLAIVGQSGHVATFDWQTGTMHAELQLQETCRDITYGTLFTRCFFCSMAVRFLQDQSFFAVAQKKYVFIYDRNGVELHRLKSHIEPTRLEFLPYHWLLASVVSAPPLLPWPLSTSLHRETLGT